MSLENERETTEIEGGHPLSRIAGTGPVLAPADFETIDAWCAGFQAAWDALWKQTAEPGPMEPFTPACRAWGNPTRLVAARRAVVAAAAVVGVWKVVLGH